MQMLKNKTMAIVIALILVSSMAISLNVLSTVKGDAYHTYPIPGTITATKPYGDGYDNATYNAIQQGMYWTGMDANASATRLLLWTRFGDKIPTYCFIMIAPTPDGVGQTCNFVFFNPQVPPNSLMTSGPRYHYKIDITDPNGTVTHYPTATQTVAAQTGGGAAIENDAFTSDSTGSTYMAFTPDIVGNYTVTVNFVQFRYLWNSTVGGGSNDYYGTVFLASNATSTLVVQQEPISPIGYPAIQPFPTAYWTRPIEGQNTNWYTVSSNWLCNAHDRDNGGSENRYQPDGTAPNSPHILWTRPTEDNGLLGGTNEGRTDAANSFNAGSQYQPRFTSQIIMYGRLYYSPNLYYSGSSSLFDCVDLKTGQLLWEQNATVSVTTMTIPGYGTFTMSAAQTPSFGYYYSEDNPNEHGIQNPGWIFSSNYAVGYQPERGIPYLNITGVPSGFEIQGPSGENVRYVLTNLGTTAKPNYYLAQWNSSHLALGQSLTPTQDGSLASCYDWNVSMPWNFSTSPTVRAAALGDILFGSNGSWPTGTSGPSYAYPQNVTVWAISLKTASLGQIIYMKTIDVDTSDNQNIMFERASGEEGVFVAIEVPTCKFIVYSIATGDKLFETDAQADLNPYGYYTWPSLISATQTKLAYGMLYTGGYSGSISAYNLTTGQLAWRDTYPSGAEKINNYVQMLALICDGKIFVGTHEHSADTPLYKGEQVKALNATTGQEIWTLSSWAYPTTFATADGVLIYWNNYDGQVYAIGQGPTSMTVTAPDVGVTTSTPVTIRGTVMDVSAGTTQSEQAADFPYGVPAVSDASQSAWMEYVYMQKAKPTNATGVPVSIDVVDSNGNYRNIGTATSDSSGMFSLNWTPDITGSYTVIATFAGSNGYYGSSAETSFYAGSPAPTASPYPTVNLPPTEMYIAAAAAAIIIVIVIVGALIMLMLRKRP